MQEGSEQDRIPLIDDKEVRMYYAGRNKLKKQTLEKISELIEECDIMCEMEGVATLEGLKNWLKRV